MKKSLIVISVLAATALLMANARVLADNSTPTNSGTSSTKTTKSKKKKTTSSPTPQVTPSVTPQVTPSPTPLPKATPTPAPAASSAPSLFSGNARLYDRVGAPGDLQKAISTAARVIGSGSSKHDRAVFLWLGRVTNGDDNLRNNSYIRFSLDGVAFAGPKKPSLILTGTVFDQSGSNCKSGDPISVAVDFRQIKVDYEGTKLGEVNKGNDIADQVFSILTEHAAYQWVLIAQDQVNDAQESLGIPTFVVKAQEGYVFLSSASNH